MNTLFKPLGKSRRKLVAGSIRELVFGIEDGVTQNMILVAGMVGAQLSMRVIAIVAGINGIAGVLSMSMGTYLSSKAEQDVERALDGSVTRAAGSPKRDAFVMAGAYAAGALIPVLPFTLGIDTTGAALGVAMILTAVALFALGMLKATLSRQRRVRSGLEMLVLASGAGLAGYLIGAGAQALFDLSV